MEIFTRNLGFTNFNEEEMQWVKIDGITVYESWKDLIASGVPPLTLSKCKGVDLVDYKIYGNSIQDGTPMLFETVTENKNINDAGAEIDNTNFKILEYMEVLPNSTYVFNGYQSKATSNNKRVSLYNDNYEWIGLAVVENIASIGEYNINFETTSNTKYIRISTLKTDSDINIVRLTPTPDAPIEVESVGNKSKNLIDYKKAYSTYGAFSFIDNGFEYVGKWMIHMPVSLEIGQYYTFSSNITGYLEGLTYPYWVIHYTDNTYSTSTKPGYAQLCEKEADRISLYISNSTEVTSIITNIQLEEGKTATEYEPYGYKIPVKVKGKNLLPYPYYMGDSDTLNGISWKVNEDKSITLNGTASANTTINLIHSSRPILFKAGTYTISGNNIQNSGVKLWFREVGSGTNLVSSSNGNSAKLTLTKDSNMYVYITVNTDVNLENATIYPLLEVGDIATEYEPYVEPITTNIYLDEPLRKIGDYADYIDFKNQKVIRNIGIKEFNGTEAIDVPGTTINGFTPFRFLEFRLTGKYPYLCNYLEYSSDYYHVNQKECLSIFPDTINGQMFFIISNDRIPLNDITGFKNWLAELYTKGKPLLVYYGLIIPIEETIELPNIPTHKGTTIIEIDTNINPSNMEVIYKGKK